MKASRACKKPVTSEVVPQIKSTTSVWLWNNQWVPATFGFSYIVRGEWNHLQFSRFYLSLGCPTLCCKIWLSTEVRRNRQNRVLYSENKKE